MRFLFPHLCNASTVCVVRVTRTGQLSAKEWAVTRAMERARRPTASTQTLPALHDQGRRGATTCH